MGACEWCGRPLKPGGGPGRPPRFCCRSHRQRSYEARRRIRVVDVAELDGWRCHLCGEAVDPEARVPQPGAATVDHVLPLRRGGGDDPSNVRLAHFACNSRKADRYQVASPDRIVVMKGQVTEPAVTRRCRWCNREFEVKPGPGRPKEFCKQSCRQMDYTARRRNAELGLGESELVVARAELDQLRDALYVLEAAIEDVDRDLADAGDDPAEVRRALDWVLQAARPLLGLAP